MKTKAGRIQNQAQHNKIKIRRNEIKAERNKFQMRF